MTEKKQKENINKLVNEIRKQMIAVNDHFKLNEFPSDGITIPIGQATIQGREFVLSVAFAEPKAFDKFQKNPDNKLFKKV